MKKYIIAIALTLMGISVVQAQKEVDSFQIQVDGLGCPFCAYGLEKKFKEFKGIKEVSIQIETGDFSFTYPTEKELNMQAVVTQVKKAGYTPKSAKIIRANGKEELFVVPASAEEVQGESMDKASLLVQGNCQMCKYRIEAAAMSTKGVKNAIWNVETKVLVVGFLKKKTSKEKVAESIAKAGHDSEQATAYKKNYEELPLCCAYRNPNAKTH